MGLLAALVSCGIGTPSPAPTETATQTMSPDAEQVVGEASIDGAWLLERGSLDGTAIPLPGGTRTTLFVDGVDLSGQAACNHYGARLAPGRLGWLVGPVEQTLIGCHDEALASERSFFSALQRVTHVRGPAAGLIMTGVGIELRFIPLPPAPTDALVDRAWVMGSLGMAEGDVVAPRGNPATLDIRSDGTFSGSTGCRTLRGEWTERGDQLLTPRWDLNGECPAWLERQDGHVVSVIEGGFIPSVEGDTLTVTDPSGNALVYRGR